MVDARRRAIDHRIHFLPRFNGDLLIQRIHLAKTTGMMLGSYGKEFRLLPQACFSCGLASSSTVAIHRSVSRDDREG